MRYVLLLALVGCARTYGQPCRGPMTAASAMEGAVNAREAAASCRRAGMDEATCTAWDQRAAYWEAEAMGPTCEPSEPSPRAQAASQALTGLGQAYSNMAAAQTSAPRPLHCTTTYYGQQAHTTCN